MSDQKEVKRRGKGEHRDETFYFDISFFPASVNFAFHYFVRSKCFFHSRHLLIPTSGKLRLYYHDVSVQTSMKQSPGDTRQKFIIVRPRIAPAMETNAVLGLSMELPPSSLSSPSSSSSHTSPSVSFAAATDSNASFSSSSSSQPNPTHSPEESNDKFIYVRPLVTATTEKSKPVLDDEFVVLPSPPPCSSFSATFTQSPLPSLFSEPPSKRLNTNEVNFEQNDGSLVKSYELISSSAITEQFVDFATSSNRAGFEAGDDYDDNDDDDDRVYLGGYARYLDDDTYESGGFNFAASSRYDDDGEQMGKGEEGSWDDSQSEWDVQSQIYRSARGGEDWFAEEEVTAVILAAMPFWY